MAAVTICSDLGAQKKSDTISTVSPSISHEVMGLDAMIFVFWMLSFKPTFSLSTFTFIRRLFSSSSLSALVSSKQWKFCTFLVFHDITHFGWVLVSYLGECTSIQLMLSHVQFSYASLARILQKECEFLSASDQCTNKTGCFLRLVMLPWKSAGFLYCNASPSLFIINTLGEILLEWYSVSHQNFAHWF